jgi:hypothetical protein
VNQETFELAEAIGDLFVQNRALELRAALDVISIKLLTAATIVLTVRSLK